MIHAYNLGIFQFVAFLCYFTKKKTTKKSNLRRWEQNRKLRTFFETIIEVI